MKYINLFMAGTIAMSIIAPLEANAATTYTVKSGDSLSKIAFINGVTIAQLMEWNQLTKDRLNVGQILIVAQTLEGKKKGTLITSNKKTASITRPTNSAIARVDIEQSVTYVVIKGDTLTKIASIYNTTVTSLKQWNQLTSDLIYVGQKLHIKDTPSIVEREDVEADIDFPSSQISATDKQINTQLAKETAINTSPLTDGLSTYLNVINLGQSLKGIPYLFGGNTTAGFDCSGFIYYVFSNSGINVTRKSSLDYFLNDTTKVTTPVPGDLVFFKNTYISGISHMGIYIGEGQFLHAGSKGIEVSKLSYTYWKERFVTYKRFNTIQ